MSSAALIIVAAGEGRRLGGNQHKALIDVAGRPLVEHTLRRLLAVPFLDPVVLVGHPTDRTALLELLARLPREVALVDGGARRQDSVAAGLAALGADAPPIVLVHDGARPLVPLPPLAELVRQAAAHGCALLAVPVADTLKEASASDPLRSRRTVARERLWAAQTPQAFRRAELSLRLAEADRAGRTVTDEALLFEDAGLAVRFVEGSRRNFKVTTHDDLELARALLAGGPEEE